MIPEIPLTLVGAIRVWKQRLCATAPGTVWITWLRHPAYGTLGIYVLPKPIAMGEALPNRTWVCVRGVLRPLRVVAMEDADPRSERDSTQVPLLIHATSVTLCEHTTPMPSLKRQQIRVRSGRWIGNGYLVPTQHVPDLVCLVPTEQQGRALVAWNYLYGVLKRVGRRHYLRYVLIHTPTN
jgi:hypothetical protein